MGYTTEFEGRVFIYPPLNEHEISFLNDLAVTRRMNRTKGPLFVMGSGFHGQGRDEDVINYNDPHPDQPGLWCQWTPNDYGDFLEWDGEEKFYYAAEWMEYIVKNLLAPSARAYLDEHVDEDPRLAHFTADHQMDGEVDASGEEEGDLWRIVVENNVVKVARASFIWGEPEAI